MMTEKLSLGMIQDQHKILPINELYTCIQGEGSRAGRPTVAIRTTGCTHRCYFGDGGWCDSWYSSIHPEKGAYTLSDIFTIYEENPHIKEMMLTGGSPTMLPEVVNTLANFCANHNIVMTIETEGSHFVKTTQPIGLLSISPKFDNSVPVVGVKTPLGKITDERMVRQHNKFRLNYDAICRMIKYHTDYHLKIVMSPGDFDTHNQLNDFREEMKKRGCEIPKNKIWIMPAGDTREEQLKAYGPTIDYCEKQGYNFTGRPHIIAWNSNRGV